MRAQKPDSYPTSLPVEASREGLADDQLLDIVQRQTLRYFWRNKRGPK